MREAARTPEAPHVIRGYVHGASVAAADHGLDTRSRGAYGNGGSSQASPPYTASVGNEEPQSADAAG